MGATGMEYFGECVTKDSCAKEDCLSGVKSESGEESNCSTVLAGGETVCLSFATLSSRRKMRSLMSSESSLFCLKSALLVVLSLWIHLLVYACLFVNCVYRDSSSIVIFYGCVVVLIL